MIEIAPSILNANLLQLETEVQKIKNADWLHFDVMDGQFVPNLTFGPMFVQAIHQVSQLPIEAHLMVERPEFFIPLYAEAGSRRIIIHEESTAHIYRLVQQIKECGCQAGVALNPGTSLHTLEPILAELDLVLLMTVNPGFGGQKLIPGVTSKVKELREQVKSSGLTCRIEVDGGITWENVVDVVLSGVDIVVAGTMIYKDPDPESAVRRLKLMLDEGGNSTVF